MTTSAIALSTPITVVGTTRREITWRERLTTADVPLVPYGHRHTELALVLYVASECREEDPFKLHWAVPVLGADAEELAAAADTGGYARGSASLHGLRLIERVGTVAPVTPARTPAVVTAELITLAMTARRPSLTAVDRLRVAAAGYAAAQHELASAEHSFRALATNATEAGADAGVIARIAVATVQSGAAA